MGPAPQPAVVGWGTGFLSGLFAIMKQTAPARFVTTITKNASV